MQYTFIYQALLEHHLYGDTEMDVSSLERHLQALHSPTPHFHKLGLEEEFRVSLVVSVVVSVVLVPQSSATPSPVTPLAGLWIVALCTAETDQRPDHEGEHADGQPAGQHEEGPCDTDHPV